MRDAGAGHWHRRGRIPYGKPNRLGPSQVVTTLSRSIIPIEHNLSEQLPRCPLRPRARRRGSRAPALEEPGSDARRLIEREIERALAEDGAEAIVLGCAGMTELR